MPWQQANKWNKPAIKQETKEECNLISQTQKNSKNKSKGRKHKAKSFDFDANIMKAVSKQELYESDNTSTSDKDEWLYTLAEVRVGKSKKKKKLKHIVPVLIGNLQKSLGKPKYEPICILLDSGTTGTIILHKYIQKLCTKQSQKPTLWKTKGGNFTTAQECKILFQLPEG